MANTIKVSVSVGRTINLGNYESLRLDEGATVEVAPELAKEKFLELSKKLDDLVEEHGVILAKRIKERAQARR